MKLDATVMRNLNQCDFRVLVAVEKGMKNHELVPSALINSIAMLRHGGVNKSLSRLLRDKLVSHDQSCGYDGYRLTNSGYDILGLKNLKTRGFIVALGDRIGTGKESDVYIALTKENKQVVIKIHRLGRISFRNVKKKRDYFQINQCAQSRKRGGGMLMQTQSYKQCSSWLFLSRVSALKEYSFMKALYEVGYPTPIPIAHNRHMLVMSLIRGIPLYQIRSSRLSESQSESIFEQAMSLSKRLAYHGLVHCDLNEYNLMVDMSGGVQEEISEDYYVRHSGMSVAETVPGALSAHVPVVGQTLDGTGEIVVEPQPPPKVLLQNGEPKPIVTLIDFPQMVSSSHPNAPDFYERDCLSLKRFFETKLKCLPQGGWDDLIPAWSQIFSDLQTSTTDITHLASKLQLRLDQQLQASGFSAQDCHREMDLYYHTNYDQQNDSNSDTHDSEHESIENSVINLNDEPKSEFSCEEESIQESLSDSNENQYDQSQVLYEEEYIQNLQRKAHLKVKNQMRDQKQKQRQKKAFTKKNSNKSFVLGKRMHKEGKIIF